MIAVQGKAAIRVGMRNAVPNDVVPQKEAAGAAHWRSSLRTRIALWAGLVNVALLLLLVLGTAWFARRLILDDARRDTHATTQEAAQRLDGALHVVTITTQGMSDLVGGAQLSPDELMATLRAMVKATPGCAGGLLILEPRTRGDLPFARYVAANGRDRDFIADGYPFRAQGWYQRTVASPRSTVGCTAKVIDPVSPPAICTASSAPSRSAAGTPVSSTVSANPGLNTSAGRPRTSAGR